MAVVQEEAAFQGTWDGLQQCHTTTLFDGDLKAAKQIEEAMHTLAPVIGPRVQAPLTGQQITAPKRGGGGGRARRRSGGRRAAGGNGIAPAGEPTLEQLLGYLQKHPTASQVQMASGLGVSRAAIRPRLQALQEQGLVKKQGSGPQTTWIVTEKALQPA